MDDILNDVFSMIRLESCVYFQRDFHAPWAMRIEGTGFAQFHVVTRGRCVVETGDPAGPARTAYAHRVDDVSVGDILLFPKGASHTLADTPGREPLDGPAVMASLATDTPAFSSGGTPTRLICGHYGYRRVPNHPLIDGLPEMIHVRSLDLMDQAMPRTVLGLIIEEVKSAGPGSGSVIERLAEVLLVQILRAHVADDLSRISSNTGFLFGAMDTRLARAIQRIHQDYHTALTLEELARTAGMSRSGFAQTFKDIIGMAPIEYLTKWRMYSAGDMLEDGGLPVSEVAVTCGYESDIAFARAFKREFGVTPSQYRRQVA